MLMIKHAAATDITLIRELTMQVWPQTYVPIIGEEQVAYMLHRFYRPEELRQQMDAGHDFLLCYDGDIPAAFASFSQTAPSVFKLHKLYILPGRQGQGTGRYIINYIAATVKEQNGNILLLNVNRYNHSAISFYKKAGFTHIRDEDIDIGGGYFMNDHVLGLAIPPSP